MTVPIEDSFGEDEASRADDRCTTRRRGSRPTRAKPPGGIRFLAWLGPSGSEAALKRLRRKLPASALQELANARARLPTWLAGQVSALMNHA